VIPLEGRNAGWINNALECAIERHGSPKHIISDQGSVFTGDVFVELLDSWNIKPRLGAIGKHGSIAVTERVIKTLKYEWLKRVSFIRGFRDFLHRIVSPMLASISLRSGVCARTYKEELTASQTASPSPILDLPSLSHVVRHHAQLPSCSLFTRFKRREFLKQMLGKNDQILDIDNAIAPRHRANIIQRLIRTPVVNH